MRVLIVLLAMIATAQAQGVSYIGMCNPTWDCDKTLQAWGGKPIVFGWLEQSFGNRCRCVEQALQAPQAKTLRVHLINSPCMRNLRCGRRDALYGFTTKSANRAVHNSRSRLRKVFQRTVMRVRHRLTRANGQVVCYVSPCLECDLNDAARKVLLAIVSRYLPNCVPVDNPLRASCLSGYTCEKHGPDTDLHKPCIYDLDGTTVTSETELRAIGRQVRQCHLKFYWEAWMNCNDDSGRFVLPSLRQCNSSLTQMKEAGSKKWN